MSAGVGVAWIGCWAGVSVKYVSFEWVLHWWGVGWVFQQVW